MNQSTIYAKPSESFGMLESVQSVITDETQAIYTEDLKEVLEQAFDYNKNLLTELNTYVNSPLQSVMAAQKFKAVIQKQHDLALQIGGAILEAFGYEESFQMFFDHLDVDSTSDETLHTESAVETSAEIHSEIHSEIHGELNISETKADIDFDIQVEENPTSQLESGNVLSSNEDISHHTQPQNSFTTSPSFSSLNSSQSPSTLFAVNTGKTIKLPAKPQMDIDLQMLQSEMQGTFKDSTSKINETIDHHARFMKNIAQTSQPQLIVSSIDFKDTYSHLQRISDHNYIKLWKHNGTAFCRMIAQFVACSIRYLKTVDFNLRPNGMTGETAYDNILQRIRDHISDFNLGYMHSLDTKSAPMSDSWLTDSVNAFRKMQNEHTAIMTTPKQLNGDQQLDQLRMILDREFENWEITEQIQLILDRTDITSTDTRLCSMLMDHYDILTGKEFKNLRRKIRDLKLENERDLQALEDKLLQGMNQKTLLPDAEYLAGKRLVLIGGDRRSEAADRLRNVIPDSVQLEWLECAYSDGSHTVHTLQQSINQGNVDVVLIIQNFVSHSVSTPLKRTIKHHPTCKSQMVVRGYGHAQLCVALKKVIDEYKLDAIRKKV